MAHLLKQDGSLDMSHAHCGDMKDCIAEWSARLLRYRERLTHDPMFNPIKQVAFDLSRALESGKLSQTTLLDAAKELCDRALAIRAGATRHYVGVEQGGEQIERLKALVRESAYENDALIPFAAFAEKWSRPRHGAVFTAHPTFAMSEALRAVLVRMIEAGDEAEMDDARAALSQIAHAPDPGLDLRSEHRQVQMAIVHAQEALRRIHGIILEQARALYPADWWRLRPQAATISSWVGYDLDGRTDIKWHDSLIFRLSEKRIQLVRYVAQITALKAQITDHLGAHDGLDAAAALMSAEINALHHIMAVLADGADEPDTISRAANLLTRKREALANSIAPARDLLAALLPNLRDDGERAALAAFIADLNAHGLGTAYIHIRINAAQLQNAIRAPLGLDGLSDLESRTLLKGIDQMILDAEPEQINFASIAIERTTAIRQFLLIAQILKHIDGEAPVRLLIAECEHPFTVLTALYFARLFGVADKVDISPLMETPRALDQGGRLIETLLKTKSYRDYVTRRGRLSVQTGFSDAGRFIGQMPAALAIERLHGRLADIIGRAALQNVELLVFDTHGESMGRGGHPESLKDRFDYVMSPWVRARLAARGVSLHHETSFQGGDGYVLFGSADLAFAVLTEKLLSGARVDGAVRDDPFYTEADFSLDYFERVKTYQARLFENPHYLMTLAAFGTSLLPKAGSRQSKRQYDARRDSRSAVAEMRAIPHNAILQQFSYLVNVVAGIGSALQRDHERFAEIYQKSDRTRRLLALVAEARRLSSIKTIVAYASLFDDAFWVTRPLNGMEPHIKEPCLYLADLLRGDPRHDSMMHLATFLRKDALYLQALLCEIGLREVPAEQHEIELDLLHALRIAMIQHIYLLAARVPPFSARNDITRADIMELIVGLRIKEATGLLTEAFPKSVPKLSDYDVEEPATYTGEGGSDYAVLHRQLIEPIAEAFRAVLEISVGISHHYRAHG